MILRSFGPMLSGCLGMSEAYSTLARFYDVSIGVDYEEWVRYLLAIGLRHYHLPGTICDLGCGTGNLTVPLARRGYELTGVDRSSEMIEVANAKAAACGEQISFFVEDLRDFYLPGEPFDTVISGCDVLNYLTTESDLRRAFDAVHSILCAGGLWLFDLNSAWKLKQVYGHESYADLQDDIGYFWDNSYDDKTDICTMELTFFVRTTEGLYERKRELHRQKLWTPRKIGEIANASGFALCACYDFLTVKPCSRASERWQFVLQKKV